VYEQAHLPLVQILRGNVRREVLRQVAIHAIKRQLVPSVVKRCHHVEIGHREWKAAGPSLALHCIYPPAFASPLGVRRLRLSTFECPIRGAPNTRPRSPNTAKLDDAGHIGDRHNIRHAQKHVEKSSRAYRAPCCRNVARCLGVPRIATP